MSLDSGDTFFTPERRDIGVPRHLWIIVSDTSGDSENVLIVNVTSWKDGGFNDDSCTLDVGDHPSIHHKSFICYELAKVTSLRDLDRGFSDLGLSEGEPVSGEVLTKIRAGANASPHLRNGYKKLLQRQGLV